MKHYFRFASLTLGALAAVSVLSPSVRAQVTKYELGISIGANDYGARCWTDMVKADARVWNPGTNNAAPRDGNGFPTTDCDIFLFDGGYAQNNARMSPVRGTYRLYFTGQADIPFVWSGSIQNKQYNAVTNTTTADYVITDDYPSILLPFRNTRRTPGSPLGSGITGIKLMRPVSIGSAQSFAPDTVFTPEYLAAHNRGGVLRMMDFTATNSNIVQHWSDRRRPEELTYSDGQELGYGWQGRGAPFEAAILLCNTLDKDLWVCVPVYATDDYVLQLARLIKNTLEPERKIYFEYSNEVWNFGFAHFGQVQALAQADLQSNPSTSINYDGACIRTDGSFDGGIAVPRYWARRAMQLSDIFRAEFGDASMMTRVRPLFETQAAWQHWIYTGILFMDRYYNNGDGNHVPNPRPLSAYFWGAGGSAYIHGYPEAVKNDPNATTDSIIAGYDQAWVEHYDTMSRDTWWCSAFGLKRVSYEAGPGLDDFAGPDSAIQTAQRDPRMKGIYKRVADEFFKAGGELFTTFLGVNTSHGLLPYDSVIGSQPKPKQEAFDEMAAAVSRPIPTVGFAIPSAIPGGRFHVNQEGWQTGNNDGSVALGSGYRWLAYTVRVANPGAFSLALPGATGNGNLRVEVDGKPVGALAVPGAGTIALGNLSAGVHGIRLFQTAGSTSVASLNIQAAVVPVLIPGAPTGLRGISRNMQAALTWTAPVGQPVISYNVYRSATANIPTNATPFRIGITTPAFTDTGLRNRQKYYYRVAAVNSAGTGAMSNEVMVIPAFKR